MRLLFFLSWFSLAQKLHGRYSMLFISLEIEKDAMICLFMRFIACFRRKNLEAKCVFRFSFLIFHMYRKIHLAAPSTAFASSSLIQTNCPRIGFSDQHSSLRYNFFFFDSIQWHGSFGGSINLKKFNYILTDHFGELRVPLLAWFE